MFFRRKHLDERIAALEAELAGLAELLEAQKAELEALRSTVAVHEARLKRMRTRIVLRDGDSPFCLELFAGKGFAGVWAHNQETGSSATIQNVADVKGPVVGLYGEVPEGRKHDAMEVALFYDKNVDGGTVQFIDEKGLIHWASGRDFGPGLALKPAGG